MLRRWLLISVPAVLVAAGVVALASASRSAPAKSAASSFLPTGVTPAGNDWGTPGGDIAGSGYSTLNQINTKNV